MFEPPKGVRAESREAETTDPTEYDLKAVFLLRFATPYVKWQESAFESKTAPFVVAVVGKDPFGEVLDEVFAGKQVGEHPIRIVRKSSVDELEACHMLFVPKAQEKHLERIRERLLDKHTLLVAESIAAAQAGAHIGFYLEKSRVRFAINPAEAKSSNLEVSSELLKLAKLVEKKAELDR